MEGLREWLSSGFQELIGRARGPLNFRLVVMPTMVVLLAIRAHLRDVRAGKPVFLGAFITSSTERRRLLRSALKDVGKVLIVALVLDTAYQYIALKAFHPGQALIVAVACAVIPYVLVRGPVTRLVHYLRRRRGVAADLSASAAKPVTERRASSTKGASHG
jgi:hypothetical protein